MKSAQRHTLLLRVCVVTLFLLICLVQVLLAMRKTEGRYIYPLDDMYITMSIAKNFSQYAVWGVTRFEFSSCSSTPLYLLLLAGCYRVTGVNEWWPLILAIISGALAIVAADHFLSSLRISLRTISDVALVLFVPLFTIAETGMEHSLHILLSLLFLGSAVKSIDTGARAYTLFILAPIMVLVRFESIFMITICAALLLVRRRWKDALWLTIAMGQRSEGRPGFLWSMAGHGCRTQSSSRVWIQHRSQKPRFRLSLSRERFTTSATRPISLFWLSCWESSSSGRERRFLSGITGGLRSWQYSSRFWRTQASPRWAGFSDMKRT